jgi:archaemetzincin
VRAIHLVAVGGGDVAPLLDHLSARLARYFGVSCHVDDAVLDAGFAYDDIRGQYYSTAILARLAAMPLEPGCRRAGVTLLDLYVPVLTFVFGEAQLGGPAAIISAHRLRESYYGMPEDPARLSERVFKNALHELGHTFGLRHCDEWSCVMSSAHAVERLDAKQVAYCPRCKAVLEND